MGLEPTRLSTLHSECSMSAYSITRTNWKKRVATNPHLPAAAHYPLSWWPPHRVRSCRSTFFIFRIPLMVGVVGLEPTRPLGHQILSLTRLPIPSYPHIKRILGVCSPTQQHHWRFSVFSNEPSWIHLCMLNAPDKAALFHARESYGGFWQDPHRLSCFQVQIKVLTHGEIKDTKTPPKDF